MITSDRNQRASPFVTASRMAFLQKPFTPEVLAVRQEFRSSR